MSIALSLLPEFDHEMANTRKILERLPDEQWNWKPHDKSWPLGGLATHVANLPTWTLATIQQDSFDYAPVDGSQPTIPQAESRAQVLENFDANITAARDAIEQASDECLLGSWTALAGGVAVFTMPRIAVLRSFVMNHMIHHRAQLGMYLRLSDIPVPALYGPTADESPMQ